MEEWKDIYFEENGVIYDYRGLYQVSSEGRVKSLNYRGNTGQERILKKQQRKDGYEQVSLYKNGEMISFLIHRLIAQMFIKNDNPTIKTQVNHIDENKENNHVSNLEWVTVKQNANHGTRNKRTSEAMKCKYKGENHPMYGRTGKNNPNSKAVIGVNIKNPSLSVEYSSIHEAEKDGFNKGAICSCCKGKCEFHKGYYWYYKEDYLKMIEEV